MSRRDPIRIPLVAHYVAQLWKTRPDMRLGQFLLNTVVANEDLYFIEDDELMKRLAQTYVKQEKAND